MEVSFPILLSKVGEEEGNSGDAGNGGKAASGGEAASVGATSEASSEFVCEGGDCRMAEGWDKGVESLDDGSIGLE